ncbi:MAG: hypothetical protein LC808_30295 [Actinobacteria bacterium]|nr:hypothetical protein [Actinomycetota bacterium]
MRSRQEQWQVLGRRSADRRYIRICRSAVRRVCRVGVSVTLVNVEPRFVERIRLHQVVAGQVLTFGRCVICWTAAVRMCSWARWSVSILPAARYEWPPRPESGCSGTTRWCTGWAVWPMWTGCPAWLSTRSVLPGDAHDGLTTRGAEGTAGNTTEVLDVTQLLLAGVKRGDESVPKPTPASEAE